MNVNSSRAFEGLEGMLVRRGVSRAYAGRYVGELRDHREDVVGEMRADGASEEEVGRLAEERIGSVKTLAEAAVAKYRRGTVMGRHAWLFFGVLPVVIVPVGMISLVLAVALPLSAMGVFEGGVMPQWRWELWGMIGFMAYVYPSVAGMLYYRAVRRRALGWGWRVGACAAALVWGGWCEYTLRFNSPGGKHGMFAVGMGLRPNVMQLAVVAGAIALFVWRVEARARRGRVVAGEFF